MTTPPDPPAVPEASQLRHDQLWLERHGVQLVLGLKVRLLTAIEDISTSAHGAFYITGLALSSDGIGVSIMLGTDLTSQESDGWSVFDLIPILD